jgi:hypothetical protein
MLCERYKKALTEAVSGETGLPIEVQAHVDACPACRATLADERMLFSAIDLGLKNVANAAIPVGFVPAVHTRIAQESKSLAQNSWRFAWIAGPIAATVIVTLLAAWHFSRRPAAITPVVATNGQLHEVLSVEAPKPVTAAPTIMPPITVPAKLKPNSVKRVALKDDGKLPEVLVQPDSEIALVKYVDALRQRQERFRVLISRNGAAIELAELKIDALEVTPLLKNEATTINEETEEGR